MSSHLRCLRLSLRALEKVPAASVPFPARSVATRRCIHASASRSSAQPQYKPIPELSEEISRDRATTPRREPFSELSGRGDHPPHHTASSDIPGYDPERIMVEHLNSLFQPLEFPPELARRILTHASHKQAVHGHNGRLSFMGRRVLDAYFLAFLHSTPGGLRADHAALAERALNSYVFGEHIAGPWQLGRVLRWTPPDSAEPAHGEPQPTGASYRRSGVGLYKVAGTATEALVGGVFHQFGGAVAHRLFHTHILPRLPNVPEPFRSHALEICERMGGRDAPILSHAAGSAPVNAAASAVPKPVAPAAEAAPVQPIAPGKHVSTAPVTPKFARGVAPHQVATPLREKGAEQAERRKLAL